LILKYKKLSEDAVAPAKAHDSDAGFDFFSTDRVILSPGQRKPIRTGVAVAIPEGMVGLMWSRSGLAFQYGVDTKAGCIDSDYRGEVMILLENNGSRPIVINKGDKVSQMVVLDLGKVTVEEVEDLDETVRGEDGFGSTDKEDIPVEDAPVEDAPVIEDIVEEAPVEEKPKTKAKAKAKQKKPKQKD